MENKIKHLEFVQAIINKMSNHCFLLKVWCLTLLLVIFSLVQLQTYKSFFVVLIFYFLDTYFLYLEKLFRKLYDLVRTDKITNFSMKIQHNDWLFIKTFFALPNLLFYLVLISLNFFIL